MAPEVQVAIVTTVGAVLAALIGHGNRTARKGRDAAERAESKADAAARLSAPTGNGFANEMRAFRHEMRAELLALHGRIDLLHTRQDREIRR